MKKNRITKVLYNPHFWILFGILIVFSVLHYSKILLFSINIDIDSIFGLQRHAIVRKLLLIPIFYAAFIFGLKGGIICLAVSLIIMLPRVLIISSYPNDAIFETCITIIIGILINWWLESRRKQIGLREQALLKLEAKKSELQKYVKIIEESKKCISALHSISAIINRSLKIEEVLDITAVKIKEVMDIDIVLIYFLSEDSLFLNLKSHKGAPDEFILNITKLKVGEGFNGYVAETGESIFVEDITQDPRFLREKVRNEKIISIYIVPLKTKDKIIGTLCIAKRNIKKYTQEEKKLLSLIGIELGVAAEKAAFLEELQKLGKRFQEIFEKAHDAIWIQNKSGEIITANKATSLLTGYNIDDLTGSNISLFFQSHSIKKINEVEQKLLSKEDIKQPYEQKITKKNSKEAVIMLTTSVLGNDKKSAVFLHIARDITDEKRLQENLRLYANQINNAYEEERKRIARELHDDTIQSLVAISRRLDNYITQSVKNQKESLKPLEIIHKNIDKSLVNIRRFVQDLRPPTLEYLGLLPALRELVNQIQNQSGIKITLCSEKSKYNFPPEKRLLIYRIIQEAISNVWKHSNATKAEIVLKIDENRLIIEVIDNGKGFEINTNSKLLEMGKLGLMGMEERAHLLGGSLDIISNPDEGTIVTLILDNQK